MIIRSDSNNTKKHFVDAEVGLVSLGLIVMIYIYTEVF